MIRFEKKEHLKILIFISDLIRKIFGGDRTKRISKKIEHLLKNETKNKKKISIVDFGCGSMEISKKIQHNNFIKKISGVDIFNSKFKYKKLEYFQYKKIKDLKNFKCDVMLLVDVLHHIGVNESFKLLKELSKYSKIIIIKDHFEHGQISRQLLRFVDFYANYAYGVVIPKIYYSEKSWAKTIKMSKLKQLYFEKNFQQHDGIFNLILNKKHHFISVLKK
tara:strand:+ start:224 stop:883 length:660 start_codon:yes stop_codon:yes gene_type:complete